MTAEVELAVRLVAPDEAELLIELIRRCYGESYIDPSFYDLAFVQGRLRSGRLHSIGAFAEPRKLLGHMGISPRSPRGLSADAGMTLVDPAFRGRGIARRVALGLAQQAMALGLVGVHDYPVTVHAATQRIGAGFGVDSGLMLANMPGDVEFQEMDTKSPGSRTSSLIRWLPFGRAPERSVCVPTRYRVQIEKVYADAHLQRTVISSGTSAGDEASELESSYDERRQILRLAVTRIGGDLGDAIGADLLRALERGGLLAHVDLPLGDAGAPAAVDALRAQGFFFAGLLPEYRDGDVLRMQWLADSIQPTAADVLSTPSTRTMETFVLADRP